MSGTLVTEISVSNVKKINHGLPLHQNNMNGVYITNVFDKQTMNWFAENFLWLISL
jgi:hypothetical protein